MILQKGDLIRHIDNKDVAEQLIKKCGYKEIKEPRQKENKPEENK